MGGSQTLVTWSEDQSQPDYRGRTAVRAGLVLTDAVLLTDSARRDSLPHGDYPGRIATKRAHSRRCLGQQAAFEFESQPASSTARYTAILPPDARGTLQIPRIEDVQTLTCAILYGTEEDRARAYKDPGVQRVLRYYEELAKLPSSNSEPR
jgi:hypothetical protein